MPIPRDEQKKYKSLAKIGQFFTELKFNKNQERQYFYSTKKNCSLNILHKQYLYYKVK